MTKITLTPFNCPVCKNSTLVQVEIDEKAIKDAPRLPAVVLAKCKSNHSLVLFVDGNFQVRDVEPATEADEKEKDAVANTVDWFSSL